MMMQFGDVKCEKCGCSTFIPIVYDTNNITRDFKASILGLIRRNNGFRMTIGGPKWTCSECYWDLVVEPTCKEYHNIKDIKLNVTQKRLIRDSLDKYDQAYYEVCEGRFRMKCVIEEACIHFPDAMNLLIEHTGIATLLNCDNKRVKLKMGCRFSKAASAIKYFNISSLCYHGIKWNVELFNDCVTMNRIIE
jgi:hypothetical protein